MNLCAHVKLWIDLGKKAIGFLGLTKHMEVWTQILMAESFNSVFYASETFQKERKKVAKREGRTIHPIVHLG